MDTQCTPVFRDKHGRAINNKMSSSRQAKNLPTADAQSLSHRPVIRPVTMDNTPNSAHPRRLYSQLAHIISEAHGFSHDPVIRRPWATLQTKSSDEAIFRTISTREGSTPKCHATCKDELGTLGVIRRSWTRKVGCFLLCPATPHTAATAAICLTRPSMRMSSKRGWSKGIIACAAPASTSSVANALPCRTDGKDV